MGVGWAVFRNYAGHAKEILGDVTDYPRFFLMPPSAMVEATEAGENVVTLLEPDEHIDHEVEMVFKWERILLQYRCVWGLTRLIGPARPWQRRKGGPGSRERVSEGLEYLEPGLTGTTGRWR